MTTTYEQHLMIYYIELNANTLIFNSYFQIQFPRKLINFFTQF